MFRSTAATSKVTNKYGGIPVSHPGSGFPVRILRAIAPITVAGGK
jgi:hypothetical protein